MPQVSIDCSSSEERIMVYQLHEHQMEDRDVLTSSSDHHIGDNEEDEDGLKGPVCHGAHHQS